MSSAWLGVISCLRIRFSNELKVVPLRTKDFVHYATSLTDQVSSITKERHPHICSRTLSPLFPKAPGSVRFTNTRFLLQSKGRLTLPAVKPLLTKRWQGYVRFTNAPSLRHISPATGLSVYTAIQPCKTVGSGSSGTLSQQWA